MRYARIGLLSLLDKSWMEGDLERELHQYRTQLDAHPVSPIAVLRLRQQVVGSLFYFGCLTDSVN